MHKPNYILESDVKEALDWDPKLDASRIVVNANDGKVTLSGSVYTYAELVGAADDARAVGGVTTVDNELVVGPVGEDRDDAAIAAAAADAMDRDKLVPHRSVAPVVVDGWVTLIGEVRRQYERKAAECAVHRIDGILGVTDNIIVNSHDAMPSDVGDRITKAFKRSAIIDDSLIEVAGSGHTVYLDGAVGSFVAMAEAEKTAWSAPGVDGVVNRLVVSARDGGRQGHETVP
jgi:osmotically-inducible protein OsmY